MTRAPYSADGARPAEMPAVRTTIVGGRPPGCGKPLGDIPRGIEVLVKKASVDAAFRATLLSQRAEAASQIGLLLTPEETLMLNHVPAAQLEAIIARTKVDPSRRNAFLSKAAGVMLAALGASAVVSGGNVSPQRGDRVDVPPTPAATEPGPISAGIARLGNIRSPATATAPASQPSSQPASAPATRPDLSAAEIDTLIKQLDDDKYPVREAAHKKLQDQGVGMLPTLREALKNDKLSAEARSRLESITSALAATTRPVRPRVPRTAIRAGIIVTDPDEDQ